MARRFRRSGSRGSDAPRPAGAPTTALGLLVAGSCLLAVAVAVSVPASILPVSAPQADGAGRAGQEPRPPHVPGPMRLRPVAGLTLEGSSAGPRQPTSIRIPALRLDRGLVPLTVDGSVLQVPEDHADVGWWSDGPLPGRPGAAVVVGHLDSPTGPAVFYGLSGLTAGDRVVVARADDSRAVFAVRQVRLYDRGAFPSDLVYRTQGRPGLNLLTCGGRYDRGSDRYTGNVVVFTDLVGVRRPRAERAAAHPGAHAAAQPERTRVRERPGAPGHRLEGQGR